MNQKSFSHSDIMALLEGLDDGTLQPEEREELFDLLVSSAEARKVYHEYMGFVAVLQHEAQTQAEKNLLPILPGSGRKRVRKNFSRAMIYAAAIILIAAVVAKFVMAPEAVPYARVIASADVVWDLTQGDVGENTPPNVITPGSIIHVQRGVLNISLPDDTELIVEGPAKLRFPESLYQPELERGRLWIDSDFGETPFSVVTGEYLLKDIGTRFGVFAEENLEVHVFEGKVQVINRKSNEELATLEARDAISVASAGKSFVIPLISGPFPTKELTSSQIRLTYDFSNENDLLGEGWAPVAGNWKLVDDGLKCVTSLHGVIAHRSLPAKTPFFVSMDFEFMEKGSRSGWAGIAWGVPIDEGKGTHYYVFRVSLGQGRVTISRLKDSFDKEPVWLARSKEAGGDLSPLKPGHKYRMTVNISNEGEVTGTLYDLNGGDKALITLKGEGGLLGDGHLGIYTAFDNSIAVKHFTATTTLKSK